MANGAPTRRRFRDRVDAGHRLAARLRARAWRDPVVLALPRGGVPVAAAVADAIGAPLEVVLVRKLSAPRRPETAIGAIAEAGVRVIDQEFTERSGVTPAELNTIMADMQEQLEALGARLRDPGRTLDLSGRTAIIVDDGIATGATATAAARAARRLGATYVVVAAPVAAMTRYARIDDADEVICLTRPADFHAVGQYYDEFEQVGDDEATAILAARPGLTGRDRARGS